MPILGFSALSKIKKLINSEFGNLEKTTNVVISETINFSDISTGNYKEVVISSLPENSILLSSTLDVNTPFLNSSSKSPLFSLGVETDEVIQDDYPTTRNYKTLVFDRYFLDSTAVISYQGSISGSGDNLLNTYPNNLVVRFDMLNIWSAGGNLNTARNGITGCGTQTAGLSFGGNNGTVFSAVTEEYNGSSWSSGGSLASARYFLGGCGTQISGLCFGGWNGIVVSSATEEYDGSSWATGGALATAKWGIAGCGTQTAGLSFGGLNNTINLATTESYNGSTWTNENSLNTARRSLSGSGIQTAGLCFGGYTNAGTVLTEEYNGTNWSFANELSIANYAAAGFGSQAAGLNAGGAGGGGSATEEYNGTSWVAGGNLITPRSSLGGCGSQLAGLIFGGGAPTASTEEYNPSNLSSLIQGSLTLSVTYSHR